MSKRLADSFGEALEQAAQEMLGSVNIRVTSENDVCVHVPQKYGPDMQISCILDPNRKTAAVLFHEFGVISQDLTVAPEEGEITPILQGVRITNLSRKTGEKARFVFGAWLGLTDFRI